MPRFPVLNVSFCSYSNNSAYKMITIDFVLNFTDTYLLVITICDIVFDSSVVPVSISGESVGE